MKLDETNVSPELFQGYWKVASPHEEQADDDLTPLILDHALPAIRAVVARKLTGAPRETIEDVVGTATLWLIESLRREGGERPRDYPAYAAGVATKAVAQHLAFQSPERARLRRKIRLLGSADSRFFISESSGRWLCGLRTAEGMPVSSPANLEQCRIRLAATRLPVHFPDLAELFFRTLGAPLSLNDACDAFASLLGVGGPPRSLDVSMEPAAADGGGSDELPEWVRNLWIEICLLPTRQRAALLLHMRSQDASGIELFEELGVANIDAIAEVLEMPVEELAGLWGSLPLDDLQIASRLGISRQQVINLRSAARERLRRRRNSATRTTRGKDNG